MLCTVTETARIVMIQIQDMIILVCSFNITCTGAYKVDMLKGHLNTALFNC